MEKMVGSCEALIPSLLALADQGSPTFKRLLAETLGFFCSCGNAIENNLNTSCHASGCN